MAVLAEEIVRVAYVASGSDAQPYVFRGATGTVRWPRKLSALGAGGAWNWAWRIGLVASDPAPAEASPRFSGGLLLLHLAGPPKGELVSFVNRRLQTGEPTVVTGTVAALRELLAESVQVEPVSLNAYQGLAAIGPQGNVNIHGSRAGEIFRFIQSNDWTAVGRLAAVGGERQTPGRALVEPIEQAPVALLRSSVAILNGEPFSAYQAWLQGHEDLNTWLGWRPRLWWLDDYAVALAQLIETCIPGVLSRVRRWPLDLSDRTLVLRHDLDHSRDLSMLNLETVRGVQATHAVLLDQNTGFWRQELSSAKGHEIGFHYNTAHVPSWVSRVKRRILGGSPLGIRPQRKTVAEGGLAKQLRAASRKGIRPRTLLRHLSFIYYPEIIDAMGALPSAIIGGSSFFRGRVIRFGDDLGSPIVGDFPDTQFPTLFPFRPFDPVRSKLLSVFEGSSIMEAEPELVASLLDLRLPFRWPLRIVLVAGYHPAHAHTDTIRSGGTLAWLNTVIDVARNQGIPILTLESVYRRCKSGLVV